MKDRATCYGCDYFFNAEELTDLVDSHLPDGIKLCPECMSKGESNE